MLALLIIFVALAAIPAKAAQSPRKHGNSLQVADVLFEDYRGGFSPNWEMKAGEKVVLSFRIVGFGRLREVSQEGLREHRVKLHYQIGLHDPHGKAVVPQKQGDIDTVLRAQDEKWRPKVDWSATVPSSAPSGRYTVHIQVSDGVAKRHTAKNATFLVFGRTVPPADHLQIEQLEYAASENGPWNPQRYFSPADTIWVRYNIVGFRVSPEKQVWVEQDWAVLNADGKVIVQQPDASVQNERSFYPPRFLSTIFSLKLKNPIPGKYTLQVKLRDRVGDQLGTFDSDFHIRP